MIIRTSIVYRGAALAEIGGCFAFWAWLRLGATPLWLVPGTTALVVFAWLLTLVGSQQAGDLVDCHLGPIIRAWCEALAILSALGSIFVQPTASA